LIVLSLLNDLEINNEIAGEWSDDLIDKVAEKLKSKSQNEAFSVIAEFLPDPIRDTLSG
jgi:hypothetical protein